MTRDEAISAIWAMEDTINHDRGISQQDYEDGQEFVREILAALGVES